jgi:hypothetical protein
MRRLLSLAVAVVVVLACLPAAGHAQAPAGDSVTGEFTDLLTGLRSLGVEAHSGPSGEQPSGTVSWHFGGGLGPTWSGRVTCLSVAGKTAIIGFSGTERFFGEEAPSAGLVRIFDGGGTDSRQDTFEWAATGGEPGGPDIPGPTTCAVYPAAFTPAFEGVSVNEFGDVIVTDSRTFPTSKDECKNGGWKTFGVFKNQGDCVSFVATGRKNPPARKPG